MDAFTFIVIAVYFRFISKHWWPFQLYGIGMNLLCCLALFFIPESPKYLYSKRRYEEAKKVIRYIAKFNRVKDLTEISNFKFEDELNTAEGNKTAAVLP